MRRAALVFFFLLLGQGLLGAEPALKLSLAPSTRLVLPNGLTLIVRERHEADNVSVYLMLGAGQLTEEQDQMGITHLLQNVLLEIPVEGYHDAATAIEAQGGVVSAASGPDSANINMDVPSRAFPFTVKILGDLMREERFDAKIFEEVKQNALEDVRRSEEDSYQGLYSYFLQTFYTFHPYKVPVVGLSATVKTLSPKLVFDYYSRYYVPNNMVMAVVGNVATDRVIHLVNRYFSGLPRKPVKSKNIYYQPILDERKHIQFQQAGNVAWLFMGFSAPELKNDDYPPMEIINSILGASMSSRIWLSIREKRGLSYELGSQYSAREGPSHFVIFVATSPENLRESRSQLLREIDRIRREPLTPEEMAVAKRRMVGQFVLGLETNLAQARFLAWGELEGKGILYDEQYVRLIQRVSPADVQRVAKKYLEDYILISVE